MKKTMKLASLLLALVMVFALATTAFATDVPTGQGGTATITVNNASKGETYSLYKIFDATYNTVTGSIAYTYNGTLPANNYFTQDATTGAITATDAAVDSDGNLNKEATDWIVANLKPVAAIKTFEGTGEKIVFTELQYGYYLVESTTGALVAVNSTTPNATMNDKNSSTPEFKKEVLGKDGKTFGEEVDTNIGQSRRFKLTVTTHNYYPDENPNPVANYIIDDIFPAGEKYVTILSVFVDNDELKRNEGYFDAGYHFPITIPWCDANGNSRYPNNAKIYIEYSAKLNDDAVIDGDGNVNTATLTYNFRNPDGGTPEPSSKTYEDTATVYTYALGFKKVDDKGNPLAGAEFELPFYVKSTPAADGAYIYAGTAEGEGLTKTVVSPEDGLIVIKGVEAGTYSIKETKAPAGYNKLEGAFDVPAAKTGSSTTTTTITKYLDENGNVTNTETETRVTYEAGKLAITDLGVVVNKTGTTLPSTGGMGTTIFYLLGGLLVAGAVVLLVTKKRMSAER